MHFYIQLAITAIGLLLMYRAGYQVGFKKALTIKILNILDATKRPKDESDTP